MTIDELRRIVAADYDALCTRLGIEPLPLDIFVAHEVEDPRTVDLQTCERTVLGTPRIQGTPGYTGAYIILPILSGDLEAWQNCAPPFPPDTWEILDWPSWRIDLWHEFRHQVQHVTFGIFDPKSRTHGHDVGWSDANGEVARAFGVEASILEKLC